MGGAHDHTPPLLRWRRGKVMATFLLSFWECYEGERVHTSFLSQEEKRQRPWLPPFCLLGRGMGVGSEHDYTPPLLRIRRAKTMATFPPCSLPSRRGMQDHHDHTLALLRIRKA